MSLQEKNAEILALINESEESGLSETVRILYKEYLKTAPSDEAAVYLKSFYENYETAVFNGSIKNNDRSEDADLVDQSDSAKQTAFRIITNLAEESLEEDDFYKKLWSNFSNTAIFATEQEIISAIKFGTVSPLIPYFMVPEIESMDPERYSEITHKLFRQIQRIRFAIYGKYSQRTQFAEFLLKELDGIDDFESKLVLISQSLAIFENFGRIKERMENSNN